MPHMIFLYLKESQKSEKKDIRRTDVIKNQTRKYSPVTRWITRKYAHAMKQKTLILLTGVFPDTGISSTDPTTALSKLGFSALWSWSSSSLAPERARKAFLAFLRDSACRIFFLFFQFRRHTTPNDQEEMSYLRIATKLLSRIMFSN